MRIAHLANPKTPNGFYRGVGPMMRLAERGHNVMQLSIDEKHPPLAEVRNYDVLHVHRYCDDRALKLVREAQARGVAVVWDNDDDMGSLPKGTPAYRKFGGLMWERRLAAMKTIFRIANRVTAPSTLLAERLRGYGAERVETLENNVPASFLQPPRQPSQGVTIGWVAGLEHQLDVEALPIRDTLERMLDERPELHVVTIGLGLGLRNPRYRQIGKVPIEDLSSHTAAFDIGIAPLADIPINRSRSNIKLKEYAAGGTPWLASPVGPYLAMGEQQGGRLSANDDWYEKLTRLLDKPRERRKLAKRATNWAAGETMERHAAEWEAMLAAAVEDTRLASARRGAEAS